MQYTRNLRARIFLLGMSNNNLSSVYSWWEIWSMHRYVTQASAFIYPSNVVPVWFTSRLRRVLHDTIGSLVRPRVSLNWDSIHAICNQFKHVDLSLLTRANVTFVFRKNNEIEVVDSTIDSINHTIDYSLKTKCWPCIFSYGLRNALFVQATYRVNFAFPLFISNPCDRYDYS